MTDAGQHVDIAALNELRQIMGDEFSTLIETFQNDSVIRIQTIEDAVSGGDPEQIRRAAHSFKGSASNMGAIQLADLCRRMEELGHSGTADGCDVLYKQILAEYDNVRVSLAFLQEQ